MNFRIKNKKIWLAVIAFAGVIMIILPSVIPDKKETKEEITYYSEQLEQRITDLISDIDGIENVSVMLTLDCGNEYVYAENTDSTADRTVSDYVVISSGGGESTVQLKEIYPRVRGVAVVCTGGDAVGIKNKITELLSSSLGIPTNRITVCG